MAEIIRATGECIQLTPQQKSETGRPGKVLSLRQLKDAIGGGLIEIVRTYDRKKLIVLDEEGKLKGLSLNSEATRLYTGVRVETVSEAANKGLWDVIVGDVVIADPAEIE